MPQPVLNSIKEFMEEPEKTYIILNLKNQYNFKIKELNFENGNISDIKDLKELKFGFFRKLLYRLVGI